MWISLFQWDGVSSRQWVGFHNYAQLFRDPTVTHAFEHAAVLTVFYAVFPLMIGLFVASSLARVRVPGSGVLLAILFLPQVVAPVVVGCQLALDLRSRRPRQRRFFAPSGSVRSRRRGWATSAGRSRRSA